MEISSINFVQNVLPKTIKSANNASNIAFSGYNNERNVPSGEQCTIFFHPVFELQKQLLEDGYSLEEIRKHQIFDVIEINAEFLSNPDILTDVADGKVTKNDIITHQPKNLADVKAIQKAYTLLKQKFNTPDVQKYLAKVGELEEDLAQYFKSKGMKEFHRTTCQSLMLEVLHNVDRNNVALLEELLDDENYENTSLYHALMKLDKNQDMRYAHQVHRMAQEIGYKKEFSTALAVLISEANSANIKIIEKMLEEQDFLIENDDFVRNRIMSFLRFSDPNLAINYLINDDLTLSEIDEMMRMQEEADEDEDF